MNYVCLCAHVHKSIDAPKRPEVLDPFGTTGGCEQWVLGTKLRTIRQARLTTEPSLQAPDGGFPPAPEQCHPLPGVLPLIYRVL